MAGKLGMDNTDMTPCLPTVLGSEGSSPLEMAEVYSTFANRGIHREPTIITRIDKVDKDGVATPLWVWEKQEQQVLTQTTADLVTEALVGVIDHGTGHAANIDKPAAGKTGTTSFNRDAWFVGYTPGLTAAVWMGYPEKQTLPDCNPDLAPDPEDPDTCAPQIPPMQGILGRTSITGGSIPAEIWQKFMVLATAGQDAEFVMPTPEQARSGRQLGDGGGYSDETTTTIVDEPSDPNPSSTTSSPQNSTTSTTENTDPPIPPSFPFPTTTSTTRPRPGGGGGSPP
jgi:membrane peptidoglycan carboxypeptidase